MSSEDVQEQPPSTPQEEQDAKTGWIWFITGPTACGKTTIAKALAKSLGFTFVEGDDYHPSANRTKMSRNEPLTDGDRAAWLDALRADEAPQRVVTCSALKRKYRDLLRRVPPPNPPPAPPESRSTGSSSPHGDGGLPPPELEPMRLKVGFVLLDVPADVLRQRARDRKGHFAKEGLVESQLRDLELPREGEGEGDVLVVKVGEGRGVENTLEEVVGRVKEKMGM
ncbi:P-loop containing nucleoside triphosphate hydrolase protein [Chaetomium strumarium]|uniref:gluconokinase n=1 Tax=Chaetomium strumarium TaxID=1170767 RepID=A0AAJ0GUH9_9PEZI|nr:P-loop containing nucleoside triphosphate hydrolase protein [Chaetomium strumarium]